MSNHARCMQCRADTGRLTKRPHLCTDCEQALDVPDGLDRGPYACGYADALWLEFQVKHGHGTPLAMGPGEPRFDAGRSWAYAKVREILELTGQTLVFDATGDVVGVTRGNEGTGKLPSERIDEIAKEARGVVHGSDGVTAGVLVYSVSPRDVAQYLDERLGRAPVTGER